MRGGWRSLPADRAEGRESPVAAEANAASAATCAAERPRLHAGVRRPCAAGRLGRREPVGYAGRAAQLWSGDGRTGIGPLGLSARARRAARNRLGVLKEHARAGPDLVCV